MSYIRICNLSTSMLKLHMVQANLSVTFLNTAARHRMSCLCKKLSGLKFEALYGNLTACFLWKLSVTALAMRPTYQCTFCVSHTEGTL